MPITVNRSGKPHIDRGMGTSAAVRPTQGQGPQGGVGPQGVVGAPGGSDASFAAFVADVGSATRGELSATLVGKGGASKTDGQNPRNLRRPTLVVDKIFPNNKHDHQIVWVDEALKIAYAIGQDNRLRKSTWLFASDEAVHFGTQKSEAATTDRWCDNGVFLRIPTTGVLLMEQVTKATGQTVLLRSADDGATWTTAWTAPATSKRFLGPQSLVRDANTGYLYLVEYTTDVTQTTVSIWRSTDTGVTWTNWKSYPRAEAATAGSIRHWHSARYDSVSQRVYFMAGDTNDDAGLYRVNAAGTDIEVVIKNSQVASQFPDTPTSARAVDVMFFATHIAWACDGGGGQTHLFRMARTAIGQATPAVERVAAIDSTGWYAQNASADGSIWVCSTSTETGITGTTPDPGTVHLYAVSDNGAVMDEVGAVVMDGALLGIASVTGLGGGSGGGDAFWLRAHTYQQTPFQTFSAFQFRARIANGVVPILKPPVRPVEYLRQGRNCGPLVVAAGATVSWGHTRAPRRTTSLSILEYGAKALLGAFGTAKIEVWNTTTTTKLFEWAGQSWRYDGKTDTDEYTGPYPCASGDQIEFKVTNTGVAEITASAFIEFGWSFG